MRASVRAARPVAAAAAFAATAALAVTLTSRAPMHVSLISSGNLPTSARDVIAGARHPQGGPPQCGPSRLDVSIGGAATARIVASHDHLYLIGFPVEFTNISGTACTLTGYPQVSAYLAGGAQAGNAAAIDTSVSAQLIVLAPGETAHAAILDSASGGRCRLVAAAGLRVVPPGQSVPWFVRHAVRACLSSGRTAPVFLHVRAIEPGAGAATRTTADRRGRCVCNGPAPHLATRLRAARKQPVR